VYSAFGIKALFASNADYVNTVDTNNGIKTREASYDEGAMPDVMGMGLRDALYLLGNAGLKPRVTGSGKVVKQSVAPGLKVGKGYPVTLELN
jgi:cell division protein FtsI (penicillin-binding protein 3)